MNPIVKNQVYELRKAGHKVRVTHRRRYLVCTPTFKHNVYDWSRREFEEKKPAYPLTKLLEHGGSTTVEITLNNKETLEGFAECSKLDSYNRKVGLAAALGRALTSKQYRLNHPDQGDSHE